ncbi:DUF4062 domain-containing protein [Pseudomonas viridiflava]|uniref:DUF4062 domain-containing protein n=1 Tax=Pseudomonas viridiflava TaxID=33069 RepID=UPI001F12946E|nr:DUF4062 domain-containing protein [Pseudomonas viridiflava]
MAQSKRIKVMLSSRCNDRFPADSDQTVSNIREQLKREIEGTKLFGKQVFEVWINEDAPPEDGIQDSWDACLQAVRDCDVLLVLSNGNAEWASGGGDIGICHAEYMEELATTRGKVASSLCQTSPQAIAYQSLEIDNAVLSKKGCYWT